MHSLHENKSHNSENSSLTNSIRNSKGAARPAVPAFQNSLPGQKRGDEEMLSSQKLIVQREELKRDESSVQSRFVLPINTDQTPRAIVQTLKPFELQNPPVQKKGNKTGLPDYLKEGVETMSGYSMDNVRVHYNSDKPVQLQALAFAQGADIHVAHGQERHLPHEAWHVVQQKQGRVRPTMQMKGVGINDDALLEKEADSKGLKAASRKELKNMGSTVYAPVMLKKSVETNVSSNCSPIQLFHDYSTWKNIQGEKEIKHIDYMNEMVNAYAIVFKRIEGKDAKDVSKISEIADFRLKSLYSLITKLKRKLKDNIPVETPELDDAASKLTTLEEIAPLIEAKRNMNDSAMAIATPGLLHYIFSFVPITGLAAIRGVNKYLRHLADTKLVFRMRMPQGSAILNVMFGDVSNYMKKFAYAGLHGSSEKDKSSLYKGLEERKEDKDKVYKTSQLGPGFYLTDGNKNSDRIYSQSVASERAKMTKTETIIFRVFINTQSVESVEVPKEMWADMEKDKTPQPLVDLSQKPKLLKAPIVKNEHVSQIKVNAPLFELVRILPPANMMDAEFLNWIEALCKQHSFDIGSIDYNGK